MKKRIFSTLVLSLSLFSCVAYAASSSSYNYYHFNTVYSESVTANNMKTTAFSSPYITYAATSAINQLLGTHCMSVSVTEYDHGTYCNQKSSTRSCTYGDSFSSGNLTRDYDDLGNYYVHTSSLYSTTSTSLCNSTTLTYKNTLTVYQTQ